MLKIYLIVSTNRREHVHLYRILRIFLLLLIVQLKHMYAFIFQRDESIHQRHHSITVQYRLAFKKQYLGMRPKTLSRATT